MGVQALINNFPLLASSEVRWTLKEGVKPFEAEFDIMPKFAEQLLSASEWAPVSLYLNDGSGNDVTINGLYVIARGVGPNPHIARILVVDRRWFWDRVHIVRHFNVRRNVGVKRQRQLDTPPEIQPLTPSIRYAPYSIRDGEPWKAKEILENVLAQVLTAESKATGAGGSYSIDPSLGDRLANLPIENLELDHAGDDALQRVLTYLPEAAVTIGKDGNVRVYSRADGSEETVVLGAGSESVSGGHVEWISNARLRPRRIHVLFTREHEVRFNFIESDSETFSPDERYMQNVLSIPDWELTLKSGERLAQGNWIPFPDALDAWGGPPFQSNLTNAASWMPFIRRTMTPWMDLWTAIGQNGLRDTEADWMGRVGAIQQHWRLTYRINPRWMARILQLKASKVSTLNPATGDRAPALVYADHCRLAGMKSIVFQRQGPDGIKLAMNVQSYPTSGNDLDKTARAAPCRVSIMDHDQGILHLDFIGDPYRMHEVILPSLMENIPSGDINNVQEAIAYNGSSESRYKAPIMSAGHKIAIVMTAIPAGNNSATSRHLQRVTVEPKDLNRILPSSLMRGIQQSIGPDMEIRINPTIETARVVWLDSKADEIEAAMGVTDAAFNIDDLIVNLTGNSDNAASLDAIAKAVAARTYAMLSDRHRGGKTVRLKAGPEPTGYLQEVTYTVGTSGATEMTLNLPDTLPQIDLFSMLSDSTRRLVLRLAPSPSGGAG
jgi:hypothetical protein